jgi:hypothetical protein
MQRRRSPGCLRVNRCGLRAEKRGFSTCTRRAQRQRSATSTRRPRESSQSAESTSNAEKRRPQTRCRRAPAFVFGVEQGLCRQPNRCLSGRRRLLRRNPCAKAFSVLARTVRGRMIHAGAGAGVNHPCRIGHHPPPEAPHAATARDFRRESASPRGWLHLQRSPPASAPSRSRGRRERQRGALSLVRLQE